jgi:SAM-dependent methyltransferase
MPDSTPRRCEGADKAERFDKAWQSGFWPACAFPGERIGFMWHQGYTSEVNYTYGYYNELSPTRIRLALLACGIDHSISDNPTYLELGFGQGLSLAINAATSSGRFYGTDFNPGQVANAQELADVMGKQVTLLEDSFEEMARRDDLPQFDIIALHGIWSWISEAGRQAIVDIALKSLKPGGALYMSYNVTPGWSPGIPLRILMAEYAKREAGGALVDRINGSLEFVDQVMEAGAAYFNQHPLLKQRLDQIKTQDRSYLAHEYYNADWHPMPFSKAADHLAQAKLTYAANASILENLAGISLPATAQPILQAIRDPIMRETTRDYFVNTQFRRDIFVKGPRFMALTDHGKRVENERFVMLGDPENCPKKIQTVIGEADLRADIHEPLTKALATFPDATASIGELMKVKELSAINRGQLWEALLILTGAGFVAPVSTSTTPDEDAEASTALNTALLERAELGTGVDYLAAPRLGSAIQVGRIEQLFIKAMAAKEKDPAEWVLNLLASQNQLLIVNGETISDIDKTRSELQRMFTEFKEQREPILRRVGTC